MSFCLVLLGCCKPWMGLRGWFYRTQAQQLQEHLETADREDTDILAKDKQVK